MSDETFEQRIRRRAKDNTEFECYATDAIELLDARDAIIAAQADIIQRYAQHLGRCYISRFGDENRICTCGLSAALAALRKLQDGG